jgi:hypothetical protein
MPFAVFIGYGPVRLRFFSGFVTGLPNTTEAGHSPPSYAAVPRSQRYNPIAVPTNRPATRAAHRRKASRSTQEDQKTKTTRNSSPEVPLPLPMLLVTPAAKLFASSASSPSSEDATSSGKVMPVSRKPSLPPTRRQAKYPSLTVVCILNSLFFLYTHPSATAVSHIKYLEAVKEQLEVRLKGADHEVHRLRNVNEALMLNRAGAATLASSAFSN